VFNRIYAGMTRIVWELNEVVRGKGGTCLIPGSHKAEVPGSSAQMSQELRPSQWSAEADAPDWDDRG
jgi:hypothetical protein